MLNKMKSRVTSQVVQKLDAGSVYGGTLIEGNIGLYDAMKMGGLDFQVAKFPLYGNLGTKTPKFVKAPISDVQGIFRTDTNEFLGTCKGRYSIVQNLDAFKWAEKIIGHDGACVTSAGALHGGKFTWICIDLGGFDVVPEDEVRKHMLILNSHNGKTNVVIQMMPYRIACQNVLDFSFGSRRDSTSIPFKIRHTNSAQLKLDEVQQVLGYAHDQFDAVQASFKRFQEIRLTPEDRLKVIYSGLGVPKQQLVAWTKGKLDKQPQWVNQSQIMERLIEEGPGTELAGVKDSLWGTFNGMNSFYEHVRTIRGSDKNPDNAVESRLFADAHRKKLQVFNACNEFASRS